MRKEKYLVLGVLIVLVAGIVNASDVIFQEGAIKGNIDGSNITSGTIPDPRLSSNVPLKNESNTFSSTQAFADATFTKSGASTGITVSGAGTGNSISVVNSGTGYGIISHLTNSSNTATSFYGTNAGSGYGLYITKTGTGTSIATAITENNTGMLISRDYPKELVSFLYLKNSGGHGGTNTFRRNYDENNTVDPVVYIVQANESDDQSPLLVRGYGDGDLTAWYNGSAKRAYIDEHGNLSIDGTISKGSGTFTIDHPLDPANKLLQHSFVESPEMRNLYFGQATTDDNKKVTITLPNWFQALNGDDKSEYTYQMTPIGKLCQFYISKEIENNQFEVSSDAPNCKFSWQLTGIRHDAYAEANPLTVEIEKQPADLTVTYGEVTETEERGDQLIEKTYKKPKMPFVSSRRKGACIHPEACINVPSGDLIPYPAEPEKQLIAMNIEEVHKK